jgi:putative RNA 2'-phosphotransferase
MSNASVRRSKQLSWLLRHGAGEQGLAMDEAGWASVDDVLALLDITHAELLDTVETNDKGRLELEGVRIRACQGHSLAAMPVSQGALENSWTVVTPSASLWHGTTVRAIDSIGELGITPGGRSHVHLAPNADSHVGKRSSVEILLEISPQPLADEGLTIFEAPNGVIMVRHVPVVAIVAARAGNARAPIDLVNIYRTLGLRNQPDEHPSNPGGIR